MARMYYPGGMALSAKESLAPVLIKIFKDLDCDICLENYTGLDENLLDDWDIKLVEFNFHMQSEINSAIIASIIRETRRIYGKCYIVFENDIIVTIDVKTTDYRDARLPNLPGSDDIIKSVLKYAKKPVVFPFTSPELLLDTFVFFNDMDGVEAVLDAYKSVINVNSIDCALDKLTEKEEINGEMVALLLEFKSQHFGFQESDGLSL